MTDTHRHGIPDFPEIILSKTRQDLLRQSEGGARRIRERMFAEAVSNFRTKLNSGIHEDELRGVLDFFNRQNVSVSVAYFRKSDPGIRVISPVINTFVTIQNPESVFLLCEVLGYKIVYSRPGKNPDEDTGAKTPKDGALDEKVLVIDNPARGKPGSKKKEKSLFRFFGG